MPLDRPPDDPLFLHSRREAIVILAVWGAFFAWVVPYCYVFGYTAPANPAELPLVLGMPAWVFWGVGVPWVTAGLVSIVLCLWFIQDDDLGAAPEDEEPSAPEA
jgi:hypothetical protein